jgi:FMN phosphatase YigB (HAD superfamily)
LADHFDAVVVSGEVGTGKPDPVVFAHAVEALGVEPGDAVMVGDNLLKDVDGAIAAGLGAIWVNRDARPRPGGRSSVLEVRDLGELPALLSR